MSDKLNLSDQKDTSAILEAINRNYAVVIFKPDGLIVDANDNFLKVMGYDLKEIQGQHHKIFLTNIESNKPEYKKFWNDLAAGKEQSDVFPRLSKSGKVVWLEAKYTPILNNHGKCISVIKFATDVTERKIKNLTYMAKSEAIESAMAIIEFDKNGFILRANPLFCKIMGYSEGEIKDKHHSIFLDSDEANSKNYANFWLSLGKGEISSGQFKRISKSGHEITLEASYTPVYDLEGNVISIIKFATDISEKEAMNVRLHEALRQAEETERIREEMDLVMQEMSTLVMPIWNQVLMMPLVGVVDSSRTDNLMRKSLESISESRAKVFILDISGVPIVDTAVANQLLKITKATRLMGCETIISGLSPAIARTIVDLGVEIGEVRTTATLRDAFAIALTETSQKESMLS